MDKEYKAAMIVIGNEILSGRTQDSNINYLANKLVECGVTLSEVRIVPDIEAAIIGAIHDLKGAVDYIFTTGGIGPTHDDITSMSVAKALGVELEIHQDAYDILLSHYGEEGLTPARLKMAKVPAGATLIPNPVSGAPGFRIENIHVMAGIPRIMQAMTDHVCMTLQGGAVVQSRTVTCTLTESVIAERLEDIQEEYPQVDIGSYPYYKDGAPGVNIVLRSADQDALDAAERRISVEVIEDH